MYGEGDPYYVTSGLRSASLHGGQLVRVGRGSALFQQAYVGNVAWAHLCALGALQRDPGGAGGRCYFVTDDTSLVNSFEFHEGVPRGPSVHRLEQGLRPPTHSPTASASMLDWVLWLVRPLYEVNLPVALPSIIYINRTLYFSRRLAEERLSYSPIFDYQTALDKSMREAIIIHWTLEIKENLTIKWMIECGLTLPRNNINYKYKTAAVIFCRDCEERLDRMYSRRCIAVLLHTCMVIYLISIGVTSAIIFAGGLFSPYMYH